MRLVSILIYSLFIFVSFIPCTQAKSSPNNELEISDFFRASPYENFTLSPSGEYVAYSKLGINKVEVYLLDLQSQKKYVVFEADRNNIEFDKSEHFVAWERHYDSIEGINWLGGNILSLRVHSNDRFRHHRILTLEKDKNAIQVSKIQYMNKNGYWWYASKINQGKVIYANYRENDDMSYQTDLVMINFNSRKGAKESLDGFTQYKKRLNKRGPKVHSWLKDNVGNRLGGHRTIDGIPELFVRYGFSLNDDRFIKIWSGVKDSYFDPVLLDLNKKHAYVITNQNHDKKVLAILDFETQQMDKIVYHNEKYDVQRAILSADQTKVIGVQLMANGYVQQHYFDSVHQEKLDQIKAYSNTENNYLMGQTEDGQVSLIHVSDSHNAGEVFAYSNDSKQFISVEKLRPWLVDTELQSSKLLEITTADGASLEAFLTLPKGSKTKNVPLLVIPHGGPIGVSDSRHYSADIQVLSNAGYATLQVNYRGSEGYGKKFKRSGMGQWGQLIEDDIEASLDHAIANYPIDAKKVCIIGSSYGGYSALMSVIRSPERYQCAASFAGVTDLSLLFQRSDIENNDVIMESLLEIVGDPTVEQEKLFTNSVIYRTEEISKPIFLAHGTADDIVDIEHAYRLRFALKAKKISHQWKVFDGLGHGFKTTGQAEEYYSQLLSFLDLHLRE